MKYLAGWRAVIWWAENGCFDRVLLSEWWTIQLLVWSQLALFMYSRLQTLAPESTICGEKTIGWKIDSLPYTLV